MLKICKILPLFWLISCTLGPEYQAQDFFGTSEPQNTITISRQWYKVFADEKLNSLIEEALRRSPDVKIAISRLQQARYLLEIKKVDYFPKVDGAAAYNYAFAPEYGETGSSGSYFKLGLDAVWELDIWGKGRRQTQRYAALYQASINNLENTSLTLAAEVANNYVLLRTTQEQLRIAEENLKTEREILQAVQKKYQNGMSDETALQQAEFALQTTQSTIPVLQYRKSAYENAILLLCGRIPDDKNDLENIKGGLDVRNFRIDYLKLKQTPLNVIRNRPDVKAAEQQLIAKNAAIGEAIAAMFPSVGLSALLGRQAHTVKSLDNSRQASYGYAADITTPLWHWGEMLKQVKLSRAEKEEYFYLYQNSVLTAANELQNSLNALEQEIKRRELLQKAALSMEKILKSQRLKYDEGLIEFSDLLYSEQNLLKSRDDLAQSFGAVCQNLIGFYKSAGGGMGNP
ncbi:MAG: TolC family protein [Alphaproteobacteria bacterium]|nr:TolC family protein [Alphaproteobacteria bacterium]